MRLPDRVGEVGVAGQRCSDMASSSSESSHREGAASISSTRVLGAERCVSDMRLTLDCGIIRWVELCLTASGVRSVMRGTDMDNLRGGDGGGSKLTPSLLMSMGVEIFRLFKATTVLFLRWFWCCVLLFDVRRRPRTWRRSQMRKRAILEVVVGPISRSLRSWIPVVLAKLF